MAKQGLITSIILIFLLSSLVGMIILASCSMGGHTVLMQVVGTMGCPASFLQHLVKWQAAFLAVISFFAVFAISAYSRGHAGHIATTQNPWTRLAVSLSSSRHMKFFDPLRMPMAWGIVGGKRFEYNTV